MNKSLSFSRHSPTDPRLPSPLPGNSVINKPGVVSRTHGTFSQKEKTWEMK